MEHGSSQTRHPQGLFRSTSDIAGQQAASKSLINRRRILEILRAAGPAGKALFEVAAEMGVPDHTISGRFTELRDDRLIEHTGERRMKGKCPAEVWRVCGAANNTTPDWGDVLGYPITLTIDGEFYDRQPFVPADLDSDAGAWPGVPYARRADRGGVAQRVHVELVECPRCGRPLRMITPAASSSGASGSAAKPEKRFVCGSKDCPRWAAAMASEPGKAPMLALVLREF
jgi:hypothetical protein